MVKDLQVRFHYRWMRVEGTLVIIHLEGLRRILDDNKVRQHG